ncbi:MAG: transcriptional regulator, partial [Bacteroidota bacterium]|nr:transcriptional regulator [Bacteroidota bacterium]
MVIISFLAISTRGQNPIGIPDIINYTRDHYNAGSQNRGIVQDRNGIMYFANYEGLLTFDGTYWKLYPLPHRTVVRSLAIGADNRIYVGSQADFGYFAPGANGKLVYTSLVPQIPGKRKIFSEVWETVSFGKDVFFCSREYIFRFSNNLINAYPAKSSWQFLGQSHQRLIAQDINAGLLEFSGG